MQLLAVTALALPSALSIPRLAVMLLALAVLLVVVVIATRRYWQAWRRSPAETPRADALRERDDHLKLALWASGEHFWDYDLVRRRMHRMRADENAQHSADITVVTRQGDMPTIHELDMPLVMQRLRSHLQGETPLFMSEHRMDLNGNGNWAWVRARGRVVERDQDGRPLRIAGTARDITASRNAEYEHRIASEVMRTMSEAVAVLDWNHKFIAVNEAFTRITGYADTEVLGHPASMLDSSQHDEAFMDAMHAELQRDGRWSGELWKVRKDGEYIRCSN
jgi:PAS domain-containing protein